MLTPAQIEEHCSRLLEPVTQYVYRKQGAEAADLTGGCLYHALRLFKGGKLDSWAYAKTLNLVIDTMRSPEVHGRKGTARYKAQANRSSIEDFDAADDTETVDAAGSRRESMAGALKQIAVTRQIPRWILLGRFLGNFTNADLQGMLDVSERQLQVESKRLRELVPSH